MHDSAVAIVQAARRAAGRPRAGRRVRPSVGEQRVGVALAHDLLEVLVGALGGGLVARDDLDLAPFQAGRDLERRQLDARRARRRAGSRRSPTRGSRTAAASRCRYSAGLGDHRAHRLASRAPCPTSAAARAAARAARRRSAARGRASAARRGPGRCRPARAPSAPSGTVACLRLASATASGSMFGQRFVSGRTIAAMRSESGSSSTISRPWKPPTTSAVRSSAVGPRPPLVTTRSRRLARP